MRARLGLRTALILTSVLLLTNGRVWFSTVGLNAGMLFFSKGIFSTETQGSLTYPLYDTLEQSSSTSHAIAFLEQAVSLNNRSITARWALGRAFLSVGNAEDATETFTSLIGRADNNPLLYRDAIRAFDHAGRSTALIALYESAPLPYPTQAMSDVVALAYLERGSGDVSTLRQVHYLRPGDLYATYHLWQAALEEEEVRAAAAYREILGYFPLHAVDPSDVRLLSYATRVIPFLLEQEVWEGEEALNVVSYLVWQHTWAPGLEALLEELVARYPNDPDWPFYLAELYHRREDLDRAEVAYQRVLEVEPEYALTYLRLGMLSEEKGERLGETAQWYARYHELAPNDLLGLKRLVTTCTMVEQAEMEDENCIEVARRLPWGTKSLADASVAVVLRDFLTTRTDDRHIVAQMLGVPWEEVELGPNLVENGRFERWVEGHPSNWRWDTYLGASGDEGLYVAGWDALVGERGAMRIVALRGGLILDEAMTLAEYVGRDIEAFNARYLISLTYCAHGFTEGGVFIFFGDYKHPDGVVLLYEFLPSLSENWQEVHFLVDGPTVSTSVSPLVRNWGGGQLYIDTFEIRPLFLQGE